MPGQRRQFSVDGRQIAPRLGVRRAGRLPRPRATGTPLLIAVAPGLLEQAQVVIREPGESDERYQSRCELFAALLDYAKRQD
jgi:hypothetical protein